MSKIVRTQSSKVLSQAVECNGFVFLAGVTADDLSIDVNGQTKQVLAKIDQLLKIHGTDNGQLLSAQIWLKDIRDRDAINVLWCAWLPEGASPARACVQANMADARHLVEIMVTAAK